MGTAAVFLISLLGLASASATHAGAAANVTGPHAGGSAPPTIGKLGPHPGPVPLGDSSAPPTVSGHYWVGSAWGPKKNTVDATVIQTTIKVPDENPSEIAGGTSEFYYVLLSTFDNNGSYDQIGFSQDGGVWGLTYSYTYTTAGTGTGCEGTLNYVYSPNILDLNPGQTYTFTMNFFTDYPGYMDFFVTQGSAVLEDFSVYTGGTAFVLSYSDCGYYDTTDYEEVYDSNQGVPSQTMHFFGGFYDTSSPMVQLVNPFNTGSFLPVTVLNSAGAVVIGNQNASMNFYGVYTDSVVVTSTQSYFTTQLGFNEIVSGGGNVMLCLFGTSAWIDYWTTSLGGGTGFFTPSVIGTANIFLDSGLTPNEAYYANFVMYTDAQSGVCSGTAYEELTITAYIE